MPVAVKIEQSSAGRVSIYYDAVEDDGVGANVDGLLLL